jgi:hypothetical protein
VTLGVLKGASKLNVLLLLLLLSIEGVLHSGRTHGDSGLSCAGLTRYEDSSSGDVAVLDHLQDDSRSPTGGQLAHHPLGHLPAKRML